MFENFKVPANLMPSDPRFGVGPSLVPVEHIENLLATGQKLLGTSHRKPAVKNVCKEIQEGLTKYFNLPSGYEVVLGNGGATFLFDMIGLGLVEKSSVHFTTGEFSNKWYKSHNKIPWLNAKEVGVEFGQGINPEVTPGYDMVCCTLNETSTGVMITGVPDVDEDTLLAVDATSGAGQIPLDMSRVDVYFFSPQKVFASEGGFFVCIMSPKALKRAEKLYDREEYFPEIMSWKLAIENSRKNQTYNTPSISTLFMLNEQIKRMNALGECEVVEQARAKAKHVYDWANSKDYLSCYVEQDQFRSIAVATINIDDKYPAEDLSKVLRAQNAALDIDAYRKLGKNQFRISLFHNVTLENLKKLTEIISLAIESEK
ncbi:MAG: phosphoserine transaminase [Halobacteriovoraceae bacterium]|nr:phosphoserine transaminase [Halobacteriovoraceae bacterium]|tara:strand:- start:3164 stop:4279 length:1116 start_codon:yes stop_codon:yes gene_type:complete